MPESIPPSFSSESPSAAGSLALALAEKLFRERDYGGSIRNREERASSFKCSEAGLCSALRQKAALRGRCRNTRPFGCAGYVSGVLGLSLFLPGVGALGGSPRLLECGEKAKLGDAGVDRSLQRRGSSRLVLPSSDATSGRFLTTRREGLRLRVLPSRASSPVEAGLQIQSGRLPNGCARGTEPARGKRPTLTVYRTAVSHRDKGRRHGLRNFLISGIGNFGSAGPAGFVPAECSGSAQRVRGASRPKAAEHSKGPPPRARHSLEGLSVRLALTSAGLLSLPELGTPPETKCGRARDEARLWAEAVSEGGALHTARPSRRLHRPRLGTHSPNYNMPPIERCTWR